MNSLPSELSAESMKSFAPVLPDEEASHCAETTGRDDKGTVEDRPLRMDWASSRIEACIKQQIKRQLKRELGL